MFFRSMDTRLNLGESDRQGQLLAPRCGSETGQPGVSGSWLQTYDGVDRPGSSWSTRRRRRWGRPTPAPSATSCSLFPQSSSARMSETSTTPSGTCRWPWHPQHTGRGPRGRPQFSRPARTWRRPGARALSFCGSSTRRHSSSSSPASRLTSRAWRRPEETRSRLERQPGGPLGQRWSELSPWQDPGRGPFEAAATGRLCYFLRLATTVTPPSTATSPPAPIMSRMRRSIPTGLRVL